MWSIYSAIKKPVCSRISLNTSNFLAVALGVWIVYQAYQEYIKLSMSPKSDSRDALDRMCFIVAVFAVVSTLTNLIGSVIVNVDSEILKFFYCIILGAFALIFLALTVATVELLDEFEDAMVYKLYEAIVHYNHSKKNEFLDKVQKDLKCCGAKGAINFRKCCLPESCCPQVVENTTCTNATAYEDTCELKVTYSIETNAQWIVFSMLLMAGYFTVVIALEACFRQNEHSSSSR